MDEMETVMAAGGAVQHHGGLVALAAGVVVAGGKEPPLLLRLANPSRPLTTRRKRPLPLSLAPPLLLPPLPPLLTIRHAPFPRPWRKQSVLLIPKKGLASSKRSKQLPPPDLTYPASLPADEKQGKGKKGSLIHCSID